MASTLFEIRRSLRLASAISASRSPQQRAAISGFAAVAVELRRTPPNVGPRSPHLKSRAAQPRAFLRAVRSDEFPSFDPRSEMPFGHARAISRAFDEEVAAHSIHDSQVNLPIVDVRASLAKSASTGSHRHC